MLCYVLFSILLYLYYSVRSVVLFLQIQIHKIPYCTVAGTKWGKWTVARASHTDRRAENDEKNCIFWLFCVSVAMVPYRPLQIRPVSMTIVTLRLRLGFSFFSFFLFFHLFSSYIIPFSLRCLSSVANSFSFFLSGTTPSTRLFLTLVELPLFYFTFSFVFSPSYTRQKRAVLCLLLAGILDLLVTSLPLLRFSSPLLFLLFLCAMCCIS